MDTSKMLEPAVVELGIEYGEGKIFGTPEIGNGYDVYWVLRGALYAKERHHSIGNNMYREKRPVPSSNILSYSINIRIIPE